MAIYTNLKAADKNMHGMFESSRVKATVVGHLYDAIVRNDSDKEIAVDNGVAIKVGEYTGDGLQTRYATVAKKADKVAIVGTPVIIKDAFTKAQEQDYNFYVKAGAVAKAYEVVPEDIFAVADYQIEKGSALAVGDKVVVDEAGAYEVVLDTTGYGFVGRIHSIAVGNPLIDAEGFTMVRIEVVQNETVA